MLAALTKVPEMISRVWGASKNILPLLPSAMEVMNKLFEGKKSERKDQMSGILGRGFEGMKDVLGIYAQQSEGMGDLAVITETLFQNKEDKTIFDTLSMAYMIIEKVPFLGSYIETFVAKIPGFMECTTFLDMIFGTKFKERIEGGDTEATSQVIQMLLQVGDLIMTQVNMNTMKASVAKQ